MSGPWGKKSAGARIEIGSPDFFVICNHTRPAPVISGQPHHSTRHIFQGHFFGVAFPRKTQKIHLWWPRIVGVFPSFFGFRNPYYTPPCENERKKSPFAKRKLQPDSPSQKFSAGIVHNFGGRVEYFLFQKITQSLNLQLPKTQHFYQDFSVT